MVDRLYKFVLSYVIIIRVHSSSAKCAINAGDAQLNILKEAI